MFVDYFLCMDSFIEALYWNTAIVKLNLNNTFLGDKGIETLCEVLKVNSSLKELLLRNTHFTIKGMNSLVSLLTESANETLEYLDLSWNKFSWESRENLSFALLCNTTLARLRLVGCQINGEMIFEGLSL